MKRALIHGVAVLGGALGLLMNSPVVEAGHVHHKGERHYIDPLVTEHAFLERKVRFDFEFLDEEAIEAQRDSDEVEDESQTLRYNLEVEWPFTDRLSGFVGASFISLDPDVLSNTMGFGNVEVGAKAILLDSDRTETLVTGAFAVEIPTGDRTRGLGEGDVELEPSLLLWQGVGPVSFQAQTTLKLPFVSGPMSTKLVYNVAFTWSPWEHPAHWWEGINPLVEINGSTVVNGSKTRNTLIQLTPGIRVELPQGVEMGAGVQFPLTDNRAHDVRAITSVSYHF